MGSSEFEEAYNADERRIRGVILSEPISVLAPREPIQLPPSADLESAIRAMNQRKTGCVCVVEQGRLVGIFTERDLLKLVQGDLLPSEVTLGKVMTPNPATLRPEDGIALALNLMTVRGFRHIPLVDSGDRPTGIVAMRDIVAFIVSMFPDSVANVPPDPRKIQEQYGG
jgi:CBS domain-containing protein